jgi:hypothetical protein
MRLRGNPYCSQPLQMVLTLIRINHVNRLVATLEPILNERKQHAILFVVAVEERTNMTCFLELGASKGNWSRDRLRYASASWKSCNAGLMKARSL